MQKISPLKASLDAFNRFKNIRKETRLNSAADKMNTNPFGITFKGTILQMDVFESSKHIDGKNIISDKIQQVSKLTSSAWIATLNKIDSFKNTIKSYMVSVKKNSKEIVERITDVLNKEINIDFSTYSVRNLQKRPLSELADMFSNEIKALGV